MEGQLPPGVSPEDSRAGITIGVVTFVLTVASIAVGLRIYTRAFLIKQFGPDDWAAVASWFCVFGTGFSIANLTAFGGGKHIFFLSPEQITLYFRTFYVTIVFYNASLFTIKLTFLLQYWRIMAVHKYKKVFIACMVVVLGWSLSQVFVGIFMCTPVEKFWSPMTPGWCIPHFPQFYINAGMNIFTDIVIFVLPLPVIGTLKLPRRQKMVLLGIFCLGFFTVSISVIRIRYLKLNDNPTWENVESSGWSIGEVCSGLTCACLPTLRPLIKEWKLPLMSFVTKLSYARQSETGGSADLLPPLPEKDYPPQNRDVETARTDSDRTSGEFEISYNFNWKRRGIGSMEDLERGMKEHQQRTTRFA